MKKILLGLVVIVALAGGAYLAMGGSVSDALASEAAVTPTLAVVQADGRVVAEAKVVPLRSASLSLSTGGVVAAVLVQEGESVQAGQPLLRLASSDQQAAVVQAEAELARAQANLAAQQAGARTEEVQSAQAAVAAAQAQLDRLNEGSLAEDVAAAEAALAAAQADLAKVQESASEEQLIAARAELANAEAAVQQAQAAYDEVKTLPNVGMTGQSLQLQQATNNLDAARARYEQLSKGPTAAELARARAEVQRAEAELGKVQAPARPADIAAAEAEVRRAEAQLALTEAGTRAEAVAVAEAEVRVAEAALARAEAQLAEVELRAPFAGVVATVHPEVGEYVAPGTPLAELGDLSAWQFETSDLTELSVVVIAVGDSARVTVDALPGAEFGGRVTAINQLGENNQGDVVYTVIVVPDAQDARLRWNMTASVTIAIE
ncbi:MAG: HlyD family secretion protein [Anaerolineae bacterium]